MLHKGVKPSRAQPLGGSGVRTPQPFHWPPNFGQNFIHGGSVTLQIEMFFYVFFEKSIISRFSFQIYTKLNNLKFEIPKIFWGGADRAPSPDPSPALSRASPSIRASPLNLGRFAPSIRVSPDSNPPTFEAWLRPCKPCFIFPMVIVQNFSRSKGPYGPIPPLNTQLVRAHLILKSRMAYSRKLKYFTLVDPERSRSSLSIYHHLLFLKTLKVIFAA